jgi:hypothetical protein
MADIAMCLKKDCPNFDNCYRAQARASDPYQNYQSFDNGHKAKCADFVEYNPPKLDFLK